MFLLTCYKLSNLRTIEKEQNQYMDHLLVHLIISISNTCPYKQAGTLKSIYTCSKYNDNNECQLFRDQPIRKRERRNLADQPKRERG